MKDFFENVFVRKLLGTITDNPWIVVGSVIGFFIGNLFAKIVNWIPLLGGIFGFMVTMFFVVGGGLLAYKIKQNNSTK